MKLFIIALAIILSGCQGTVVKSTPFKDDGCIIATHPNAIIITCRHIKYDIFRQPIETIDTTYTFPFR